MTISANYPTVRPSLLLDFANTEQLDPRITFSRPTTATYYDANTTALAEQNLLLQSQFASGWTVSSFASLTINSTTAPDGTTTGATLTSTSSVSINTGMYQGVTTAIGQTYSIYAKAGTSNFACLTTSYSNQTPWANFNLSTGLVASSIGCTASMISVGNGWYRCIMANTTTAGQSFCYVIGKDADPAGNPWNAGTWTSGNNIYIWGAQLEQRSSVTAYTPTTTTAITNYIPVLQTASANQARFDHNPTTRESLGLLIEQQSTNLLLNSNNLSNSYFGSSGLNTTPNANICPDGTQSATLVVPTTANVNHIYFFTSPMVASSTYAISMYAKSAGLRYFQISQGGTGTLSVSYDLQNGQVANTGASVTSTSITPVGDGWYRCACVITTASSSLVYTVSSSPTLGYSAFAGDGWNGVYLWGAQLEATAFPTSYIPTGASAVTRSADSASMTGTNFSSWYQLNQGTFYCEATWKKPTSAQLYILSNGSSNRYMYDGGSASVTQTIQSYDGTNVISTNATIAQGITVKAGLAFQTNTQTIYVNGANAVTGNYNGFWANNTTLKFGETLFNGTFKKISYYPVAVSATQLQALTGS